MRKGIVGLAILGVLSYIIYKDYLSRFTIRSLVIIMNESWILLFIVNMDFMYDELAYISCNS